MLNDIDKIERFLLSENKDEFLKEITELDEHFELYSILTALKNKTISEEIISEMISKYCEKINADKDVIKIF